jgi:periplasmic divalent cation tolerance protein
MADQIVVLFTCKSTKEARRIARALVEHRLAACVNVIRAPLESSYRWRGKVATAKEFLALVKTSRKMFQALEKEVRRLHSYKIPEIIAVPIVAGSSDYLSWLSESVGTGRRANVVKVKF